MNKVRALLFAASIVILTFPVIAQSQQKKAGETITGTVTQDGTSQPLPNVQVSLTKALSGGRGNLAPDTAGANTVLTDAAGRFAFVNLQPGSYTVTAQLEGYFAPEEDGTSADLVQRSVTVEEGRPSNLLLTLAPGGTITGRILDFDGTIVQSLNVQALRITESGFDTPPGGSGTTDDRGLFRLFGMPPGYYYLAVSALSPVNMSNGRPGRTYFPGVLELGTASVVRLRSGAEVSGIDFKLKRVNGNIISGQVSSAIPVAEMIKPAQPAGKGPPPIPETTLTLLPHDQLMHQDPATSRSVSVSLATPVSGQFEFTNVAPGTYDLFATVPDIPGYDGPAALSGSATQPVAFGRRTVDVHGSDVTDISVIAHQGIDIRGRLFIDGSVSPSVKGIRVTLRADDSASKLQAYQQIGQYLPPINEDGTFAIPAVPEAHYRFHIGLDPDAPDSSSSRDEAGSSKAQSANGNDPIAPKPLTSFAVASLLPDNSYVSDIRQNGMSIFDIGLSVTNQTSAPVEIFVSTNGGSVDGIVRDRNLLSVKGATVALVPLDQHRQNPALYKSGRSDAAGRFLLTGIAPGAYKLFAWDSIPPGAYRNATFMSQYEDQGVAVNISPAIPLHTAVKLIATQR